MKFGKQLERHKVPGWSSFYVDYNALKRSLKREYCAANSTPDCREKWFRDVEQSVDRVNGFFHSVADEIEGRINAAAQELQQAHGSGVEVQLRAHLVTVVDTLHNTLQDLSHFAAANYTALYKIFKKHDKLTGLKVLPALLPEIAQEPFHDERRLEHLRQSLRQLTQHVGLDSELSMMVSRKHYLNDDAWSLAKLSFSLGVIAMALVVLAVLSGMEPQNDGYNIEVLAATIPVFRLVFMGNLAVWLAGGCALVFEQYQINYLFLLDISPELNITAVSLINFASVQTGIWILIFFAFLVDVKFGAVLLTSNPTLSDEEDSPLAHLYTVVLIGMQLLISTIWVPLPHFWSALGFLFKVCFTFWTPASVTFAENILADFLTSLGRPLKDLAYTGCYLRHWQGVQILDVRSSCGSNHATGLAWFSLQLVLIWALTVRMSQCLRRARDTGEFGLHLLNFGKYTLAVFVSLLAAVQPSTLALSARQMYLVQMAGYFVTTVYAASWDLVVDFGLASRQRHCLFPRTAYAPVAALDVALRSTWLLTFLPDWRALVSASGFNSECFSFAIGALELIRRAVWATVRLEHEHLSNASRFRSVCWVPPLDHRQPAVGDFSPRRKGSLLRQRLAVVHGSPAVCTGGHRALRVVALHTVTNSAEASSVGHAEREMDAAEPASDSDEEQPGDAAGKLVPDEELGVPPLERRRSIRETVEASVQGLSPSIDDSGAKDILDELQRYTGPLPQVAQNRRLLQRRMTM